MKDCLHRSLHSKNPAKRGFYYAENGFGCEPPNFQLPRQAGRLSLGGLIQRAGACFPGASCSLRATT